MNCLGKYALLHSFAGFLFEYNTLGNILFSYRGGLSSQLEIRREGFLIEWLFFWRSAFPRGKNIKCSHNVGGEINLQKLIIWRLRAFSSVHIYEEENLSHFSLLLSAEKR